MCNGPINRMIPITTSNSDCSHCPVKSSFTDNVSSMRAVHAEFCQITQRFQPHIFWAAADCAVLPQFQPSSLIFLGTASQDSTGAPHYPFAIALSVFESAPPNISPSLHRNRPYEAHIIRSSRYAEFSNLRLMPLQSGSKLCLDFSGYDGCSVIFASQTCSVKPHFSCPECDLALQGFATCRAG